VLPKHNVSIDSRKNYVTAEGKELPMTRDRLPVEEVLEESIACPVWMVGPAYLNGFPILLYISPSIEAQKQTCAHSVAVTSLTGSPGGSAPNAAIMIGSTSSAVTGIPGPITPVIFGLSHLRERVARFYKKLLAKHAAAVHQGEVFRTERAERECSFRSSPAKPMPGRKFKVL
jgi:hypothetical protein